LALTYDPGQFSVSTADIHLGSVLTAGSGWSIVPTIDPVTGQIAIALSSTTPISRSVGGSLVTIDFHQVTGEPGGVSPRSTGVGSDQPLPTPDPSPLTPFRLVASVNPNGQYARTELEDAQGTFTLTPEPSNSFDPRMDSVVMLTSTSSTASVSAPVMEVGSVSSTVEVPTGVNPMAWTVPTQTSAPNQPAPIAEASEEEVAGSNSAAEVAPFHGGAILHGVTGATTIAGATFVTAPLTGLAFQITSNLALSVSSGPAMAVGQSFADQVFQALARGTNNASDLALGSTPKDALARQLLSVPLAKDDLEDLNGSEIGTDLDDLSLGQASGLLGQAGRRVMTVNQTAPAPSPQGTADQAAVDLYFAQEADDVRQIAADE